MFFSIKRPLILTFVGVLVMPFANSLWAMRGSMNAGHSAQTLSAELYPLLESTNSIAAALEDIERSLEAAMVFEDADQLEHARTV